MTNENVLGKSTVADQQEQLLLAECRDLSEQLTKRKARRARHRAQPWAVFVGGLTTWTLTCKRYNYIDDVERNVNLVTATVLNAVFSQSSSFSCERRATRHESAVNADVAVRSFGSPKRKLRELTVRSFRHERIPTAKNTHVRSIVFSKPPLEPAAPSSRVEQSVTRLGGRAPM